MATRRPLVLASGVVSELFPGDTIFGASTLTAGSGLVGGGDLSTNQRIDVSLVTNPSGLIFVGTQLGIDGFAQRTADSALASGNAALNSAATAQASGNAALISAATALASGNAALSSAATAQASGNAAQFTANTALVSGSAALSRAGGTMTGQIIFAAGQQITTSVNLSGGVSGAVPYQSAPGTTAFLSPGTSGQLLTTQGADRAPAWISFSPSTTLGAVGTYAFCKNSNAVSAGDLVSFSLLSYSGTNNLTGASVAAGTWRAMGSAGGNFATLYLRVS